MVSAKPCADLVKYYKKGDEPVRSAQDLLDSYWKGKILWLS